MGIGVMFTDTFLFFRNLYTRRFPFLLGVASVYYPVTPVVAQSFGTSLVAPLSFSESSSLRGNLGSLTHGKEVPFGHSTSYRRDRGFKDSVHPI